MCTRRPLSLSPSLAVSPSASLFSIAHAYRHAGFTSPASSTKCVPDALSSDPSLYPSFPISLDLSPALLPSPCHAYRHPGLAGAASDTFPLSLSLPSFPSLFPLSPSLSCSLPPPPPPSHAYHHAGLNSDA